MRAIRVHGTQPRLESSVPEPEPGPGEALVAIEAACVAPLDLQVARGEFPVRPEAPYVPGADAAGRVVAGDGVEPGARVWVRGGGLGLTRDGCWAELAAVPVRALHPLREGVDAALAAAFFVPCATARAALHEVGHLARGERVCVRGAAGSVGRVAVQMALADGAAEVIAIVASPARANDVPAGALAVVAPGRRELRSLAGADVDLLVDTVGGAGFRALPPLLRPRGRIALVGYAGGDVLAVAATELLLGEVAILPVNGTLHEPETLPLAGGWLDLLDRGELDLPTAVYPLERFETALAAVLTRPSPGRVVLRLRS